jgi:UPF0716 family protein affecting phage T7 exclusion
VAALAAGVLLIFPGWESNVAAFALLAAVWLPSRLRARGAG